MTRTYTIPTAFTEERIDRNYDGDLTLFNTLLGAALLHESGNNKPLTEWIGDYWGNPRMTPSEAQAVLGVTVESPVANLAAGDPNPFFRFIDSIDKTGNTITRGPVVSTLIAVNEDDMRWMDGVGRLLLLFSVGGDTINFPTFIRVDDVTAELPVGIPNRTYVNEAEETVVKTWQYVIDNTRYNLTPTMVGETAVDTISSAAVSDQTDDKGNPEYLRLSQWAPLILSEAITVFTGAYIRSNAPVSEDPI